MLKFESKKNIEVILNSRILEVSNNKELIFKELYDISLKNNINKLNLKNIIIEYKYIDNLTKILEQCSVLFHLDLSSNYLGDLGYTGAQSIANVQSPMVTLEPVLLAVQSLIETLELAYRLTVRLTVLEQCFTLKSLYLNCNQIGDKGSKSIAKNLGKCSALEYINLSWNEIKEDEAIYLAENLLNCWTLKSIKLLDTQIY